MRVRDIPDRPRTPDAARSETARVDLYWIPLGAGAYVVRLSGKLYEAITASLGRRPRRALYHSALEVSTEAGRFVIEITPIPGRSDEDRGGVGEGPVGTRLAGRFRLFRYEIRRWCGGAIPDASMAVDSPVRISGDPGVAQRVLDLVPSVPAPVWGRDEMRTGDMWNSNSVISWLLVRAGIHTDPIHPPRGGRAPGWDAGLVVARRSEQPDGEATAFGDPARPAVRTREA
jgi:hypothetical protein